MKKNKGGEVAVGLGWYGTREARQLRIPEVEHGAHVEGRRYLPLRGFGMIVAVFEGSKCIGWAVHLTGEMRDHPMPEDEVEQ